MWCHISQSILLCSFNMCPLRVDFLVKLFSQRWQTNGLCPVCCSTCLSKWLWNQNDISQNWQVRRRWEAVWNGSILVPVLDIILPDIWFIGCSSLVIAEAVRNKVHKEEPDKRVDLLPFLTLVLLYKLRCHALFKFSANQITWSRLLI